MKKFLVALMVAAGVAPPIAAVPLARPKLIVVISVDQFSADLFADYRQTYRAGMK
jgi:predicted AlkP superfamily pyrophosphatase or phosphodiesterase